MSAFKKHIQELENGLLPEKSHFNEDQIKTFIKDNLNYVHQHGFSDADLIKVFLIRDILENRAKNKKEPMNGDAAHVYGDNEKQYAGARITERHYDDAASVCTQPMTPNVSLGQYNKIYTSTSGGYFRSVKPESLKYIGKKMVNFWTWGRFGAGAHQGIYFSAEMNNWEIHDKDFY